MIIPQPGQPTSGVNGHHTTDGKKTPQKRRAPSPPRNVTTQVTPVSDGTSPNHDDTKPPRPPNPPSITTPTSLSQSGTDNVEHKSPFPVFIAPPPPDNPPPPIEECETPVGPIDSEFGKLTMIEF